MLRSLFILVLVLSLAAQSRTAAEAQNRGFPDASIWKGSVPITVGLPVYPAAALEAKIEAAVEVELVISEEGHILHGRLVSSGGDLFTAATQAAVRSWRLSPLRNESGYAITALVLAHFDYLVSAQGPIVTARLTSVSDDPPALRDERTKSKSGGKAGSGGAPISKKDVLVPPVAVRAVKPDYSGLARRAQIQGNVHLKVGVGIDGLVSYVRVDGPLDPILDRNARIAAAYWVFRPATLNGQPVPIEVDLTLNFSLH